VPSAPFPAGAWASAARALPDRNDNSDIGAGPEMVRTRVTDFTASKPARTPIVAGSHRGVGMRSIIAT